MKQVQSKLWVKITALFLLSILSVALFFSALGIAYLVDQGGYVNPEGFVKDHIASNAFFSDMTAAADYYTAFLQKQSGDSYTNLENFEQKFSRENSNFFFTVQDDTGKTVFESPDQDEAYQYTRSQEQYLSYNWRNVVEEDHVFSSEEAFEEYVNSLNRQNFNVDSAYITTYEQEDSAEDVSGAQTEERSPEPALENSAAETTVETTADDHPADLPGSKVHAYISYQRFDYAHVTITGYIRQTLAAKDRIYFEAYYTNLLVENRNTLIWLTAVLFVLCLALVIFLLCAAGHKEGVEGIQDRHGAIQRKDVRVEALKS